MPLRDGVPPDEGARELVDLVLVHHTLGLRPSRWPEPRGKLRGGTPPAVRTDEPRTAQDTAAWRARPDRAGFRDELRHATHARTFFHFGRDVFAGTAVWFAHAAGNGPHQTGAAPAPVQPPGGGHCVDVLVCFKPHPPYARFRRPGAPASRPRRPAAAP
ncbi:hypothetical protein ACIQB5_12725 [Streptomyces sp. NPDC088560]|uniref:hypothetical protein n=1 Tax=Streptomyces sp. NPDC088560 TaxID=3365868 RepID=UPI00381568AB